MSEFLQYLRPSPLGPLLDRMQGITPEQRIELDAKADAEWAQAEIIANGAMDGMTPEQIQALSDFFTRDM